MTINQFIGATTWTSILVIIFGILFRIFKADGWSVSFLVFLCIVGFLTWVVSNSGGNNAKRN